MLKQAVYNLQETSLTILFSSIVEPQLRYNCYVWGAHRVTEKNCLGCLKQNVEIQNRAAKIIN